MRVRPARVWHVHSAQSMTEITTYTANNILMLCFTWNFSVRITRTGARALPERMRMILRERPTRNTFRTHLLCTYGFVRVMGWAESACAPAATVGGLSSRANATRTRPPNIALRLKSFAEVHINLRQAQPRYRLCRVAQNVLSNTTTRSSAVATFSFAHTDS